MNRSRPLFWLGFCILTAAGIVALAVLFSRTTAQDQAAGSADDLQAVSAPSATLLSYQGQLEDGDGNSITDSAVDMSFKIYPMATDGSACWTEDHTAANAVDVQDGYFTVLLGQLVAFDPNCIVGDAYLELTVSGETLSPRELLTSVAHAVEAQSLGANAQTGGDLTLNGVLDMNTNPIANVAYDITADPSASTMNVTNDYGGLRIRSAANTQIFIDSDNNSGDGRFSVFKDSKALNGAYDEIMRLSENGNMSIDGDLTTGKVINVDTQGSISNKTDNGGAGPHLVFDTDDCFVFQNSNGMLLRLCDNTNTDSIRFGGNWTNFEFTSDLIPEDPAGGIRHNLGSANARWQTAYLESASCGALIETNLQTAAEQESEQIERFAEGDVLCWGDDQLELCSTANDRLIMSVADANGKPIVLGAEPVKVLGPVERGDILVSSDQPGYAMVNNDPAPGAVIAQALENLDGESGLVKAMIRKW